MKRDMELVRKIVFALEGFEHGQLLAMLPVDGYTEEQVLYHAYIMKQAGLLEGSACRTLNTPGVKPSNLTWDGHDFADAARNDAMWNQAKSKIAATVGTVAISVLIDYLKQLAKEKLGIA
jgi:hypothetical protein